MITAHFTADDRTRLLRADSEINRFRSFILDRFAAYTRTGRALDQRGRTVDPVDEPVPARGWGRWSVVDWTGDDGAVVRHWMDDDRGPGYETARVVVPWSYVFGDDERAQRRALYEQLRREFDPPADA